MEKTSNFFMTPPVRCELTQHIDGNLRFAESVDERIEEWPHSGEPLPRELSYRLNSFSTDTKKKWQIKAVTVALRAWRWRLKNLRFRRERNPDVKVDINVEFEDLTHFDGKKGVLAHCYYPGQGEISGDCHINDEWNWVPGVHMSTLGKPPLVPILIHEFGHGIGLTHDNFDNTDIMYPSFDLGKKKNKIGPRSVARGQERYGKRSLAPWIIAYFIGRRNRDSDFR